MQETTWRRDEEEKIRDERRSEEELPTFCQGANRARWKGGKEFVEKAEGQARTSEAVFLRRTEHQYEKKETHATRRREWETSNPLYMQGEKKKSLDSVCKPKKRRQP